MKVLVFDASTIITLALNNLLWVLKPLRKQFKGKFLISKSVEKEIIERPLKSKKFKLEAMQVLQVMEQGDLQVELKGQEDSLKIEKLVNEIYIARGRGIRIMHSGEIGALVLAKNLKAEALVVDERTTRMLVEDPQRLAKIFSRKLHTPVKIDQKKLNEFKAWLGEMDVIRSVELGVIAYQMGLFDKYVHVDKKDVLDAVLWAVRLRGCSVADNEIKELVEKI